MPWRTILLLVLALGLSLGVLAHGWKDAVAGLSSLSWKEAGLLFFLPFFSWFFNSRRLMLLSGTLGYPVKGLAAFARVVAVEFGAAASPAGAGAGPVFVWLAKVTHTPASEAAAMFGVDILADLTFFFVAMPVFGMVSFLPTPLALSMPLFLRLAAGWAVGSVLLWALVRRHERIVRFFLRQKKLLPKASWRKKGIRALVRFHRAADLLGKMPVRAFFFLFLYTCGQWLSRYSVLPLAASFLGENSPWEAFWLWQCLVFLGGQAIFIPGGSGGVELGMAQILARYLHEGAVYPVLFVWRFYTYYIYLLLGAPVFFFLAKLRLSPVMREQKKKEPKSCPRLEKEKEGA